MKKIDKVVKILDKHKAIPYKFFHTPKAIREWVKDTSCPGNFGLQGKDCVCYLDYEECWDEPVEEEEKQ